jgi:hypothetical protein
MWPDHAVGAFNCSTCFQKPPPFHGRTCAAHNANLRPHVNAATSAATMSDVGSELLPTIDGNSDGSTPLGHTTKQRTPYLSVSPAPVDHRSEDSSRRHSIAGSVSDDSTAPSRNPRPSADRSSRRKITRQCQLYRVLESCIPLTAVQ